jgi:hypothetical protein
LALQIPPAAAAIRPLLAGISAVGLFAVVLSTSVATLHIRPRIRDHPTAEKHEGHRSNKLPSPSHELALL